MRSYLFVIGAVLLAGCGGKVAGPQRLDFIVTTRYTAGSRTALQPADTLASRIYAENTDNNASAPKLGRLRITVTYMPRRNPFLYPTLLSSLDRDLIDKNPEDFVFLDTMLVDGSGNYLSNYLLTTTYGIRTTTGSERWQYDLFNSRNEPTASRAVVLSTRRADSLLTYQDYLLKLVVPAVGISSNDTVRSKSTRRFLQLTSGLAVPAYTVLKAGAPDDPQAIAQRLTDLILLPDGLTLTSPDAVPLDEKRWPVANRRKTRLYRTGLTPEAFAGQTTDASIRALYTMAQAGAAGATGQSTGTVSADQIFAFSTGDATPRYGLLRVVSIPSSTTTTSTAGIQLQVRMAKL